jgi:hypothetical protein
VIRTLSLMKTRTIKPTAIPSASRTHLSLYTENGHICCFNIRILDVLYRWLQSLSPALLWTEKCSIVQYLVHSVYSTDGCLRCCQQISADKNIYLLLNISDVILLVFIKPWLSNIPLQSSGQIIIITQIERKIIISCVYMSWRLPAYMYITSLLADNK